MANRSELPIAPVDWDALIAELQAMADESLGNSAVVPKDLLARAKRSAEGISSAIDSISGLQLVMHEPSRVLDLADLMRARLAARAGLPPPPVQPRSPIVRRSGGRLGNLLDDMGGLTGCLDSALAVIAVALLLAGLVWSRFQV